MSPSRVGGDRFLFLSGVSTLILVAAVALASCAGLLAESKRVAKGRELILAAGCNDCHTADYLIRGDQIPESEWLTGDDLGYRGPWGTVYPANLRLLLDRLSEEEWVDLARSMRRKSPMSWSMLGELTTEDLGAIYSYIRHLGPAGRPAPKPLPPGTEPQGRAIPFVAPH